MLCAWWNHALAISTTDPRFLPSVGHVIYISCICLRQSLPRLCQMMGIKDCRIDRVDVSHRPRSLPLFVRVSMYCTSCCHNHSRRTVDTRWLTVDPIWACTRFHPSIQQPHHQPHAHRRGVGISRGLPLRWDHETSPPGNTSRVGSRLCRNHLRGCQI